MPAIGTGDGRERRAAEGEAPHHDRRHVEVGERAAVGLGQRPAACRVPASGRVDSMLDANETSIRCASGDKFCCCDFYIVS